jgi:hypothetical protein
VTLRKLGLTDVSRKTSGKDTRGTFPFSSDAGYIAQIQDRHHRNNRRGYHSATYNDYRIQTSNIQQPTEYSNDAQCYGDIPTPIEEASIWRIIGGNVNGLNPYGDMGDLLTILERLRNLQAVNIAFYKTNVEWHKSLLRDNTQSMLQKAFGAARV